MVKELKEHGETPIFKPQVSDTQPADRRLQLVASIKIAQHRNALNMAIPNQANKEVRKAMEDNTVEEVRRRGGVVRLRFSNQAGVGHPLTWLPLFAKMGLADDWEEQGEGVRIPLSVKFCPLFGRPEPQEKLENWRTRFASKKDQSTQTYYLGEPCPLCLREEDRRTFGRINLGKPPSIVDPTKCNKYTKEASIECPDTTYYDSSQLVFFRVGNYVYRGWTYMTPDGRIEHMPRVPRGIPINELRVDAPLRAPAPR